jgi:hypothetical protein
VKGGAVAPPRAGMPPADAGLDPATIDAVANSWPALWPCADEHLT